MRRRDCNDCIYARKRDALGRVMRVGEYRCAHPAARKSATRAKAREAMGVEGVVDSPQCRWPIRFPVARLWRCAGARPLPMTPEWMREAMRNADVSSPRAMGR